MVRALACLWCQGGNKKKSSGKAEMSGSPSLHPHSTPGVVQGQEPKQKVQAEEETPLLRYKYWAMSSVRSALLLRLPLSACFDSMGL